MSDNLAVWNQVCTPPSGALKRIKGGRLKGLSDINPQWRFKAMTEVFGVVGTGWKYTIDSIDYVPGTDGQITCIARVSVFISKGGEPELANMGWFSAIPGIGASMFIVKESAGLRTNDEAPKMAVTDALSVAFKAIGVAADIYMGMHDGSKYEQPQAPKKEQASTIYADLDLKLSDFSDYAEASAWINNTTNIEYFKESLSPEELKQWSARCKSYLNSLRD